MLLGLWAFPLPVIEAALQHHDPQPGSELPLGVGVYVAEHLIGVQDSGPSGWREELPGLDPGEAEELDVADRLGEWMAQALRAEPR